MRDLSWSATAITPHPLRRRSRRAAGVVVLAVAAVATLGLGGCVDLPAANSVESELEQALPMATFTPEEHVKLGPFTMWLAKRIERLADEEDHEAIEIREVEVNTYRVKSLPPLSEVTIFADLERRLVAQGLTSFVQVAEEKEQTVILMHQGKNQAIDGLVVISLEPSELSIVRVGGRLDRMLAREIAKDPKALLSHHGRRTERRAEANQEASITVTGQQR
jgi:uncharacterized protein DUF4252